MHKNGANAPSPSFGGAAQVSYGLLLAHWRLHLHQACHAQKATTSNDLQSFSEKDSPRIIKKAFDLEKQIKGLKIKIGKTNLTAEAERCSWYNDTRIS